MGWGLKNSDPVGGSSSSSSQETSVQNHQKGDKAKEWVSEMGKKEEEEVDEITILVKQALAKRVAAGGKNKAGFFKMSRRKTKMEWGFKNLNLGGDSATSENTLGKNDKEEKVDRSCINKEEKVDRSFITGKQYDECIKECDRAVERGRELGDSKMIARALTRKGNALAKMAKTSKDYEPAIECFQKALAENQNPDTLKMLNGAEKARKDLEQQEYLDPKIADEEREKGNEFFKQEKYPEAVKHYTEALRRNPKDPRIYSNRAACYTRLGALAEGLKDAEKCIELDPTFTRGYTRKGVILFLMNKYIKALETYQQGLKHDENNKELLDGVFRCVEQLTPEGMKEIMAKAMQDPEIHNIFSDPLMNQVFVDIHEKSTSVQDHLNNPQVMHKIQKLMDVGIIVMK